MSNYNLGTASGRITVNGDGAETGFRVARVAAGTFFDVVNQRVNEVRNLGDRLTKVGASGVAGFGIAVKAASGFEAQMSAIQAVSGATEDQMKLVQAAALRIGKDTVFSASEAGAAIEELIKAGLSVTDVLNGAADATVSLAAAGGISIPEAATIAANAMNQFGLAAKDMPHVADLIAGAANASAIDVSEFGQSLQQAGAVANLTGLKIDDLSVAIAEMGNAGIRASDAGTSIKTFLMNLIPTTDQQIAKFEELKLLTFDNAKAMETLRNHGIRPVGTSQAALATQLSNLAAKLAGTKVGTQKAEQAYIKLGMSSGFMENKFFDATGKAKSLADMQQVLKDATKGMTEEQKLATLNLLFGSDAIRAAAVMSKNGAKGYQDMANAMGKVTAADVATTRMNNLSGSVEQLKGSFETAMIIVGNVFLPAVRHVVDAVTALVNVFVGLPAPVQKAIALIFGLGSMFSLSIGLAIKLAFVLGPLLARFFMFRALNSVIGVVSTFGKTLIAQRSIVAAFGAAQDRAILSATRWGRAGKVMLAAGRMMRAAWIMMTGPVGIVVAVVAALIAVGVLLYKKWQPFHDLVDRIAKVLQGYLLSAFNAVKGAVNDFISGLTQGTDAINVAHSWFAAFGAVTYELWLKLKALGDLFMKNVMPALRAAGGALLKTLMQGWRSIAQAVMNNLVPALMQLWKAVQTDIIPALAKLWSALWPVIKVIGIIAGVVIGVLVVAWYQWVKFLIGTLLPVVIKVVAFLLGKLIPVIAAIVVVIVDVIAWIVKFAAYLVGHLIEAVVAVVNFFKSAWSVLVTVVSAVFSAIMTAINFYINIWRTVITTGLNAIKAVWNAVWGLFGPLVMAVFGLIGAIIGLWVRIWEVTIGSTLQAIWAVAKYIFGAFLNGVRITFGAISAVIRAVWGFIGPYVIAVVNHVWSSVRSAFNGIRAVVSAVTNFIRSIVSAAWSAISHAVGAAVNYIRGIVSSGFNAARSVATSAFNGIRNAVGSALNTALSTVRGVVGKIRSVFSGASSWLLNAGEQIILGLIHGITRQIKNLTGTLKHITNLIPDWKGPEDTDRKLLINNGRLIMGGLISGIKSQIKPLQKTLHGITTGIPSSIGTQLPGGLPKNIVLPPAPAAAEAGGDRIININQYNPKTEKDSVSLQKSATRLAMLGVLG